ncbi:morphogenetic protein [Klebsiella pasteurii]|uniref:morphogenetic protein n=1 Tax=Klebsiella pasteurii TaxID=2587529 RepID=UPI0035D00C26
MKERGMIFNGEMVRALLDGRKTQTRRIMKVQPEPSKSRPGDFWFSSKKLESMVHVSDLAPGNSPIVDCHLFFQEHCCPFGAVGDRIWVRETFQGPLFDFDLMDSYCKDPTPFERPEFCVYKADGAPAPEFYDADDELHCRWRPSIHMPRWASRILLEITNVRVERLQEITLGDICKEIGCGLYDFRPATHGFQAWEELWQSIYGEDSWKANPWVWVIEFKRVEGGAE